MNLFDFLHQNHQQRAAVVRIQGDFLTFRSSGAYNIRLYSMGKFFAEVWYRVSDNEIEMVRGFKSIRLLEPYLESVSLFEINGF